MMILANLNKIADVRKFVEIASAINEVKVRSGNYIVDGKSIMGLFSLDLSKPVEVELSEDASKENINVMSLLGR